MPSIRESQYSFLDGGKGIIKTLRDRFGKKLIHQRCTIEEILMLHTLKVPPLLRKTLHSTNPIESMFSTVRDCEGDIKRNRDSAMLGRWLAAVPLHCEKGFRRVNGYDAISEVIAHIEAELDDQVKLQFSSLKAFGR